MYCLKIVVIVLLTITKNGIIWEYLSADVLPKYSIDAADINTMNRFFIEHGMGDMVPSRNGGNDNS